jgi:methylmalonyl-CoA mutase
LVPQLVDSLKKQNAGDILVILGGVVPPQDYDAMKKAGVAAIYGPGTNILEAAREVLGLIGRVRKAA